jgi:hypothetical protein
VAATAGPAAPAATTKRSKKDLLAEALLNEEAIEANGASNDKPPHVNGASSGDASVAAPAAGQSKKDLMLQKALELEMADAVRAQQDENKEDNQQPKLSAKELKALKKKEEKMAAKLEKKKAKKASNVDVDGEVDDDDEEASNQAAADLHINGASDDAAVDSVESADAAVVVAEVVEEEITLEDKIRKERPPPRIRVMESVQAGYVSIRMENVGITFRNQEVLKDVTWGVQNGDRIGLVGANGAGTFLNAYLNSVLVDDVVCFGSHMPHTTLVTFHSRIKAKRHRFAFYLVSSSRLPAMSSNRARTFVPPCCGKSLSTNSSCPVPCARNF